MTSNLRPDPAPTAVTGRWGGVQRVRAALGGHPVATDIAGALLLMVAFLILEATGTNRSAQAFLLDIPLALLLAARRRWPTPVLLLICLVQLGQIPGDAPVVGNVALFVALYSVGLYESRRRAHALALTFALAALMVGILTWAPHDDTWGSKIFVAGSLVAALVLGVNVRTRRAYLRSLLERAATLERERDREAQIAVDAERSRIAREMHDVVAHNLSVMIALSQGAEATTRRDPAAAAGVMREVVAVGRQALGEMRRLLGVLRDDGGGTLAPQPGDADLDNLVARVRSAGLAVELVVTGEPNRSSPGAQLALHRIVQESLTNVLKHAPGAEKAVVSVQYAADHIDVEVANDDYGSHPAAPTHSPGHGLTGMRERAAVYGGVFHAGRTAAGGWRVSARLQLGVGA